MIKNPIIIDKLGQKTKDDPDMRRFVTDILDRESEGKQYKKFYTTQIKTLAKRNQKKQGG